MGGSLALTGVAAAKPGHRPYGKTFPVASTLCKKVAGGHVPNKLKGDEAKVLEACGALQTSYDSASNTALGAEQAFKNGRAAANNQAKATCASPTSSKADCKAAKKTARQTIRADRATLNTAYKTFHTSIEGA